MASFIYSKVSSQNKTQLVESPKKVSIVLLRRGKQSVKIGEFVAYSF